MKNSLKIPEGWSVKKLGECFTFLKTLCYSRAETIENGDVHYIHYGDIHTKYSLYVCPADIDIFVSEKQALKGDLLKTGDLILLDASEDYEGTTKCIELADIKENDKVISGLHTLALRDNKKIFKDGFRAYITSMPFVKNNFWKQITGIKVYGITKDNLKKLKLSIPPLPEQEKIAEILGTWDKAIEKLSHLIEQKKLLKKGLMQRLLTGKVRLFKTSQGARKYERFSQPWKEVKLGAVLEVVSIRNKNSSITRVLSVTNSRGFILPEEQFSRVIASEDLSNYKIVKKGEFAYNPSRLNVGSIDRLDNFTDGILSPMYVIFKCNEKLLSNYMKHWITTAEFNTKVKNSARGSVRETVDFKTLSSIKINVPSDLSEQQAIADVLTKADEEIDLLNKKLILFKEQKKGLMQQLLTGNIRVKVN